MTSNTNEAKLQAIVNLAADTLAEETFYKLVELL